MNHQATRNVVSLTSNLLLSGLFALSLAGCGQTDPHKVALDKAVDLMSTIVTSHVLIDAVQNADPQMHPSTAAGAAISGGVTANFELPPEGIAILTTTEPTQTWSVVLKGDDVNKQVIIEGYGDDLNKPLIIEKIDFPPR